MSDPVLILGAGINGAAIARELALNGVDVVVVESHDIASGATAYSSRLIHGGLRYLEYGEFALVRESLGERTRLLRLAPQFVRPLNLFIPVRNRFGGLIAAARRFLGLKESRKKRGPGYRGLWTIRFGLWLYDRYARDPELPTHKTFRSTSAGVVPVERVRYPWVCSFYDAQIVFPERFSLALLEDARRIAEHRRSRFEIHTYHSARLNGNEATIHRAEDSSVVQSFRPAAIVNATGAWVDLTLQSLGVGASRLMGGTKGTHFITSHRKLQETLGGRAVYAEASDGRPVFILPFFNGTLVGTTDETYTGDPADATATTAELEYLVAAVNEVFPGLMLTMADIDLHYAGVRPLPHSSSASTAAITRRHWLEKHADCAVPTYSVIGGKLTTCRSLAEETAVTLLHDLKRDHEANSRERAVPGAENYPSDELALRQRFESLAREYQFDPESIEWVWKLYGTRCDEVLQFARQTSELSLLEGTPLPIGVARWAIEREWAKTVEDLVERRLMLLYFPQLRKRVIEQLAELLVATGRLSENAQSAAIETAMTRLQTHFGKKIIR